MSKLFLKGKKTQCMLWKRSFISFYADAFDFKDDVYGIQKWKIVKYLLL